LSWREARETLSQTGRDALRHTALVPCLFAFAVGCQRETDAMDFSSFPLAYGTQIDKVAWLQGVERTLFLHPGEFGGGSRPPPLIHNRDALLRIHVSRGEEFVGDRVAVLVSYDYGDLHTRYSQMVDVSEPWEQSDLTSTATFEIPADRVVEDLQIDVTVHDPYLGYRAPIEEDPPVWSSTQGDFTLETSSTDSVTLVIFPVKYAADGSQRLPDTSSAAIAAIRDRMYGMYPVSRVDVQVADPITWINPVSAFGGWESLLGQITTLRTQADVPLNTYYYGLFDPAADFGTFCQQGCTLGLSNLSMSADAGWARASIGLGYVDYAASTLVHEVGHAHGRLHAPCGGASGTDVQFPYTNARLGAWGYDLETGDMIDPIATADMMSYCEPHWVSDYTFGALLDRVTAIAEEEQSSGGPLGRTLADVSWQLVQFDAQGDTTVLDVVQQRPEPGGVPVEVELLGSGGEVVEVVDGWMAPFDHAPGGMALVPPIEQRAAITGVHLRLP
jgi:hypothetical protein